MKFAVHSIRFLTHVHPHTYVLAVKRLSHWQNDLVKFCVVDSKKTRYHGYCRVINVHVTVTCLLTILLLKKCLFPCVSIYSLFWHSGNPG